MNERVDEPRDAFRAAVLSLLFPGVGQLSNGEPTKAVLFIASTFVVAVVAIGLILSPAFALGLPFALAAGFGFRVYAVVDAYVGVRKRSPTYDSRWYSRTPIHIGAIVLFTLTQVGLVFVMRSQVVQAFRVPSESMLPTILVGDYIYVDRRVSARTPNRGDIIVFRLPTDARNQQLKRVVAVGGDEFQMRDKVAYVNGLPLDEIHVEHIDPATHPASFDSRDNFGPYRVPNGSYFVLGDNRDNSNDSRFWGPVPQALVLGTVQGIYWSYDPETRLPRLDRVGRLLR